MREPFKWHITINLNNGRKPSLWDFLARVPEIFVQRIVWRSKQFKSIFSDFDTLAKNVPSVGAVASLFGFLVSTETSWSLFKKVRENCTVTPKALDPADSLHHTHVLLSFVASNVNNWSGSRKEVFLTLPAEKKECFQQLWLKMFTEQDSHLNQRHSSFLNNLVFCDRNVEKFTQFSQTSATFSTSSPKEPLNLGTAFHFYPRKPDLKKILAKNTILPFVHPPSILRFLLTVKCCESFAYVAPFDVSLYILKNY